MKSAFEMRKFSCWSAECELSKECDYAVETSHSHVLQTVDFNQQFKLRFSCEQESILFEIEFLKNDSSEWSFMIGIIISEIVNFLKLLQKVLIASTLRTTHSTSSGNTSLSNISFASLSVRPMSSFHFDILTAIFLLQSSL